MPIQMHGSAGRGRDNARDATSRRLWPLGWERYLAGALLVLAAGLTCLSGTLSAAAVGPSAVSSGPAAATALARDGRDGQAESAAGQAASGEEATWVWDPAWERQVEHPDLLHALRIASTYNRDWRELVASHLAARGTRIGFGPLPEGVGGQYDPPSNRITVAEAVRHESPGVLAALLSHEVYHAVVARPPGREACLSEESYAFSWQASTWAALPAQWRGTGAWTRWHDALTDAWRADRLTELVASLPGYEHQCASATASATERA